MSESNQSPKPNLFFLIAIIFILSGATALVYEVIWTRQLTTFFGSSLYGVATVLCAFMGGLALGSILIGKHADRMKKPLAVYGVIEICIGLAAVLFPFVLKMTQPLIGSFYTTGGTSTFYLYSLVRFVVVFLLLMIPTTLMGATLPILSKAVTDKLEEVGHRVGLLYALNTAGAVLGVFATGFYMLENFGVFRTTLTAFSVDVIIGVASIVLGQKYFLTEETTEKVVPQPKGKEGVTPLALKVVLISYMVSGFVALAYQVCWTRALIFSFDTLKSTTYSFSGMLIVFLLGLTVGSALMQRFVDRQQNILRLYGLIQMGIGLSGGLSFFLISMYIEGLEELREDSSLIYWNAVLNVMIKTAIPIAFPTFLMGAAFPVVTKLVVSRMSSLGYDVARVYALNTFGAILGSFAAGFILIPLLGITATIGLLAAINLAIAAVIFYVNGELAQRERYFLVGITAVAAVFVPGRVILTDLPLQRIQQNEQIVHYEEGAMATISVVENNSGDRMIYVDDVGVAGTDKIMLTDQKSLAHAPMVLLGGEADKVLSVGFGSGGASWSYTLYPEINEIHTIEISPEVLRAAPTLTDSSHGIIVSDDLLNRAKNAGAQRIEGFVHPLSDYTHTPTEGFKTFDDRFRVLIDDARSYLRFTEEQYDVIATDCTDLRYKTNANLYDLEYFTLCREKITDRGLVVVWMPLAGLSDRAFRSALRTFEEVFPEMSVWYFPNHPTHYCLLIGGKGKLSFDYNEVAKAASMDEISDDLEEIGLRDPEKLLSCFVCDDRTLEGHLEGYPLNTEDSPIIEFESPRYGYDAQPLKENQMKLYDIQVPVSDLVTNLPEGAEERLWKFQLANHVLFKGHSAYREFDFRQAALYYLEAKEIAPFDESIDEILQFNELATHYETSRNLPELFSNRLAIGLGLSEAFFVQGEYRRAVGVASEVAELIDQAFDDNLSEDSPVGDLAFGIHRILALSYAHNNLEKRALEYQNSAGKYASSEDEKSKLAEELKDALKSSESSEKNSM